MKNYGRKTMRVEGVQAGEEGCSVEASYWPEVTACHDVDGILILYFEQRRHLKKELKVKYGDWVLRTKNGFYKVMSDSAFRRMYAEV